ncbi:pyridoxamine 5'-phosphate oxidase family protein [Nesterenkonia sp. PF2B19]|uniref:pyridoxamine 5'-phosphate oxidase family protein n=1 Tax=Nesterenkonia sp. PF2B19 TaxID=1881858 RepID=UPI0008732EE8|nr:pyridoxamine 5'-phosphate oxidase family protein [Nesterenkonia sp. PF2B19]OSM44581.1 flavin-nucleotide-binding protein [Nesterenkonia sp. PF2B19]
MMFDHPEDTPILTLSSDESWQLLEGVRHGRLVTVVAGRVDIFPVNVVADDRTLVFRTGEGSKLAEATINDDVVFEADGIHDEEAWSVVVRGSARELRTDAELTAARELDLHPWTPTPKEHFVRIAPTEISGRHFRLGEQPEQQLDDGTGAA